jgi:hypothetical protein
VLIGFSNGIRGAKRLTAPRSLGDLHEDMSCHLANNGTGGIKFQLELLQLHCPSAVGQRRRVRSTAQPSVTRHTILSARKTESLVFRSHAKSCRKWEPELWRAAALAGVEGLGVGENAHHHAVDRIDQQNAIVGDGGVAVGLWVGFCGAPLVVRRNDLGGLDGQGDPLGHHGDRPEQAHRDDDGDTDPFTHLHPLCVSG